MELISWTIYDLKMCHKIFIILVVGNKKNIPLLNNRGNFYAWDPQTSLAHIPATVGCNDLVLFITPTSWTTRGWTLLGFGTSGCWEERFKVTHTSCDLFTDWHLHNVLQRGELRWAAEMHRAVLQMSHWASLCWAHGLNPWINTQHYSYFFPSA